MDSMKRAWAASLARLAALVSSADDGLAAYLGLLATMTANPKSSGGGELAYQSPSDQSTCDGRNGVYCSHEVLMWQR